jgi:hypothetical protein
MLKPVRAGRRVAFFEDGDLWRDEEASPPESPAGWYFRPRGTAVWVGPFPTADAASVAPSRGDPLGAGRRCLEEWTRSRAESALVGSDDSSRPILAAGQPCVCRGRDEPFPPVCVSASPVLCEPVREVPEQAADGREQMPVGAPRPSEVASIARHHARPWPSASNGSRGRDATATWTEAASRAWRAICDHAGGLHVRCRARRRRGVIPRHTAVVQGRCCRSAAYEVDGEHSTSAQRQAPRVRGGHRPEPEGPGRQGRADGLGRPAAVRRTADARMTPAAYKCAAALRLLTSNPATFIGAPARMVPGVVPPAIAMAGPGLHASERGPKEGSRRWAERTS